MSADRQVTVGAFVLGGIVLVLGAVVLFGKFNLFNPSIRATIVFEDFIAGLSIGSPVTFRGVRVGAVQGINIEFDPKTKVAYIPVTVEIEPGRALISSQGGTVDLADLVTRGLRAELRVQSFVTGVSEIDLDFEPSSVAVRHPNIAILPEIPTRQSTLQKATAELSQIPLRELAEDTTTALRGLRQLTEKMDQSFPPVVDSLKTTLDKAGDTAVTAGQAIKEMQQRLDATLHAFEQTANTAETQLNQRGADLHTLLMTSDQDLRQMRDLLVDLKSMTSERSAPRANIEATLRDLAASAASLRGFANDVEHNPQLLLTGRRP